MADSFYGGMPGESFIIKASYRSIADMVANFENGSAYDYVWYGEYCIIDTINKNDPDNGKIFKRGRDFTTAYAGGVYIGQVVGPASGTPLMEVQPWNSFDDLDQPLSQEETDIRQFDADYGANSPNVNTISFLGNTNPAGTDDIVVSAPVNSAGALDKSNLALTIANQSRVPTVADRTETYDTHKDDIHYTWVNIRHEDNINTSSVYLGFQIPYNIFDIKVRTVHPYGTTSAGSGDVSGHSLDSKRNIKIYRDQTLPGGDPNAVPPIPNTGDDGFNTLPAARRDQSYHPYFTSWTIDLPEGITGTSYRNLRCATYSDIVSQIASGYTFTSVFKPTDITVAAAGNQNSLLKVNPTSFNIATDAPPSEDPIGQYNALDPKDPNPTFDRTTLGTQSMGWFVDLYTFEDWFNNSTGSNTLTTGVDNFQPICIFLGWKNELTNVQLNNDGTLILQYTYEDPQVFREAIRWITKTQLNKNELDQNKEGIYTAFFNNNLGLSRSSDTSVNEGATPDIYKAYLEWPTQIEIAEDGSYFITVTEGEGEGTSFGPSDLRAVDPKVIKGVRTVRMKPTTDESGSSAIPNYPYHMELRFTNESAANGSYVPTSDNPLNHTLNDSATREQWPWHNLSDGTQDFELNYIVDMFVDTTPTGGDFHLFVLWSSPRFRNALVAETPSAANNYNSGFTLMNLQHTKSSNIHGPEAAGYYKYQDLGVVKTDKIAIYRSFTYDTLLAAAVAINSGFVYSTNPPTIADIKQALLIIYPNGIDNLYKGQGITVGQMGDDDKLFFWYDYEAGGWYLGGDWHNNQINYFIHYSDPDTETLDQTYTATSATSSYSVTDQARWSEVKIGGYAVEFANREIAQVDVGYSAPNPYSDYSIVSPITWNPTATYSLVPDWWNWTVS